MNPMRNSDAERLDILAGLLEQASILIRDLVEEVSQYRAVDCREEELLDDIEEALGR